MHIFAVGPPFAPVSPKIFPQSFTAAILSWEPPIGSLCVTSYIITFTNITEGNISYMYTTVSNETSMEIQHLTQAAEYSFSVAGVDTGNRIGENSVKSDELTLSGIVI